VLERGSIGTLFSRLKVILLTTVVILFFPIIGAALYSSLGFDWLRERFGWRSFRIDGVLFASAYAILTTVAACRLFPHLLMPRFTDIFLLGIVLTAYRFTWRPAAFLLVIAFAVEAWVQTAAVTLASSTIVSICSIAVVARLQSGHVKPQKLIRATN
jgi:hypothetical protein